MRNRLPVHIEKRDLPVDEYNKISDNRNESYGYVSILNLASMIITIVSILTIIYLGK